MRKTNTAMSFSDEQAMLLESARAFCADKSPVSAVRGLLEDERGYDPAVWQEMAELGWLGIAIPEEFGGSELGVGSVVPVVEATGRAMLSTPLIGTTLAAQAILRAGDSGQKEKWLPQLAAGTIASLALLEDEDWGETDVHCQLQQHDSGFEIQGEKWFVTHASDAAVFVVLARREEHLCYALVPAADLAEGAITQHLLIDETQRAAKVNFSGVVVSPDQVMYGAEVASSLRDLRLLGALLVAAEAAGSAAACLDAVVDYLNTRKQFGKLIGSYQGLKHPTVEMMIGMDDARSHCYHAASLVGEEALSQDAEIACRMAKAQATDALCFAGDRAIQFHGGMGFTYECDAMLYMRRAQWVQQNFGDAYHHRKRLAGLLLD